MKVVLAEKPSVARDIARVIGAGKRRDGYFEGKGYAVTWALGHLVSLQEPDEYDERYKRWNLADLPILPSAFRLKLVGDARSRKQFQVVQRLLRQAEEIVCATDAGREGELIFRYIQIMAGCTEKPFRRLWISSLTPRAIREGFQSLKPGRDYDPLFQAARCRGEADWLIGMNASRAYTLRFARGRGVLSIGRVQTPLLAMIVERDLAIRNFVPKDYWEVHTTFREVDFQHVHGRFEKVEEAETILAHITDHPFEIVDLEKKRLRESPPRLFDLTALQRYMNRKHGFSAEHTLKVAQELYEKKWITYPRTDSRYLSRDLVPTLPALIEQLRARYPRETAPVDPAKTSLSGRYVNDAKVTDHHAIIPTEIPFPGGSTDAQALYDAVAIRFIAIFHPDCIKDVTSVFGEANGERFRARGTIVTEPGWTLLYRDNPTTTGRKPKKKTKKSETDEGEEAEEELPPFTVGEQGPHAPRIEAKQTKPPKPFTESTLLAAMETAGKKLEDEALREAMKQRGLGTPATRAGMIETLLKRGYIIRKKKQILATERGIALIDRLCTPALRSPEMTGEWEFKLKQIEEGRLDPERFMTEIEAFTRTLVEEVRRAKGPPIHFGTKEEQGSPRKRSPRISPLTWGKCPRCGAEIIEGKRGYGCSAWKEGCDFVLWKETLGIRLPANAVRELLQTGRTLQAFQLPNDGAPLRAHLTLSPDGTVGFDATASSPDPIGRCPLCQGRIIEGKKGYGCEAWRQGCPFTIWKKIAGKKISKAMVKALLEKGKTRRLKGFVSKEGKKFDAVLRLEIAPDRKEARVRFSFEAPEGRSHES